MKTNFFRHTPFEIPELIATHHGRQPAIRSHLVRLVLACVLPVWLIAGFLVYHAYNSKRAVVTEHMLETARALSMSVDRELTIAQAALQALSTSPVFNSGDIAGMHKQALELLNFYPQADIIVADATGQQLINSYRPFGSPLPKRNIPGTVQRIFQYGKPIVSDLFYGAVTRRPLIAIDVPVFVNGKVVYDLSMTLPFNRLASILTQQRLPSEWSGTILDSKGVVVATTRDPKRFVGKMAVPATHRAIAGAAEGIVEVTSLEGMGMFDAFSRSKTSNWTVVIGIPASVAMKSMYSWLGWAIGCATILSLFGIALAMKIGSSIARSIRSLVPPAMAMGRGEPVSAVSPSSVREIEYVAEALLQTSGLLEKRAAERDLAEHSVKVEQKRLYGLLEALPATVCLLTPDFYVAFANKAFRDKFGESNGRHCYEYCFGKTEQCDFCESYKVLETGKPHRWEITNPDGSITDAHDFPFADVDGSPLILKMGVDVTDRKHAEAALKELNETLEKRVAERTAALSASESTLRAILNQMLSGVIVRDARTGNIILSNSRSLEILGELAEVPDQFHCYRGFHPDGSPLRSEEWPLTRTMTTGEVVKEEEIECERDTGSRITFSISSVPVRDQNGKIVMGVAVFDDITERKRAGEALRESEEKYRNLFDNMAEEVHFWRIVRNESGEIKTWRLVDANPPALRTWRRDSAGEILGKTADEIFGPGATEHYMPVVRKIVKEGFPHSFEDYFPHLDKYFRFTSVPLGEYFITTGADITGVKKAELALKEAHDEMAILVRERTKELHEKEVLLKEIHHRVKNNLQVISSLVNLQADGLRDGTVREVLQDVTYRVRSMALVHEKLYQSADLAHVDFAEYARSLLNYLWRAHGSVMSSIQLAFDLEPVSLPVDTAVPCGLILNELAGNAIKHAFRGRSEGKVTVSLKCGEDGLIRLSVADNGVGLPYGLDWRQAKSLGLRLVQMLTKQINAGVEVDSGAGTRFEIVI